MRAFCFALILGITAGHLAAESAHAAPILQLYLEGATYNSATETWELTPPGSSAGAPFRLWAIGNVDGPGGKGDILDVKLSAVYDAGVGDINIVLTGTTAGGVDFYNGFVDPSIAGPAPHLQTVYDGSSPKLGDGSDLPAHGEYGVGKVWQEFGLGDFTLTDSQSGDFINSFPTPGDLGFQINVYEVRVTPAGGGTFGEHPFTIHFDLYNHVGGENHSKYKFAPFSHDGGGDGGGSDGGATIVPEPASMTLMGIGICICFGGIARRRRK